MNEKISRSNYPMIESADFLSLTDVFVKTLRGFETVDQSLQAQYLASLGDSLASKSELVSNGSSWSEFFTGALTKDQIEALPAGWQSLESEQLFKSLGGADCADIVNARPTSLGLLLKVAALIRDQPDSVKADFLNNLGEMEPLFKSELEYVLAYRWQTSLIGLSLSSLLNLPPDAVMAINSTQFDQMRILDRLKNVTAWNLAPAWSTVVWFNLVEKLKGFESMAGVGNISMFGHLLTGAPLSKIRRLVASKMDSSALAAIITLPAMDSLKVQELWTGLNSTDQARVFPVLGYKLTPFQLQVFLQRTKTDVTTLNWLNKNVEVPWAVWKVAGNLKLSSLPANLSTWTVGNLQSLGSLSLVLSPVKIQRLNPQLFTGPVVDSMMSGAMSTGTLKAIFDQYQVTGVSTRSPPPLLLSFLSPEQLAGPLGASLVATAADLQNLLTAANRFVPSQTRALYEQLGSQLWSAPVLRSVLLLHPQLLAFTPVAEFRTKISMVRDAVVLAGAGNFSKIVSNIKLLPKRLLTGWLEQVFSLTNNNGTWATRVLLDLPQGLMASKPGGGRMTFASLITQGNASSLLPSLALTGLSCNLMEKIKQEDSLEVLGVYRAQLRASGGASSPAMPSNIRKCWAKKVRQYLFLKSTLYNVTIQHEVELLSLMSTADIRAIGADVLLTWGGRVLTGITHPQVMIESLIAVAQESPALYLNNGVWFSDMANMADTLFLALRSVTGSVDLAILTKMRDLVPFLSYSYLSNFTKPDIQMFVRSVLRASPYSRTICTSAEGRKNIRDFILKGFSGPETWTSGELVDLGDLLIVLTLDDFKKINSSILARAAPELVRNSYYTARLSEIRGREKPVLYHEACAKWLVDENITFSTVEADSMNAAWTTLGQMHLVGSRLYAVSLAPTADSAVVGVPRRRRRQAVDPASSTVDLRVLHDTVMSVVRTMFVANMLNASQQQAAIKVVSDTQDLLGNKSLLILGYDPAKVNLTQTQVLALLATSKSANNMTATQSAQISQLASDTQVRIVQSLVKLLGLSPAQLNLTQASFNTVMALPTFLTPSIPSSSTNSSPSSTVRSTTITKGFLPGDVRDPGIFEYDDPSESTVSSVPTTNLTLGGSVNATVPSSGVFANASLPLTPSTPPATLSPLLLPLPDFESVRFTCDALRIAGRSASVLTAPAIARMTDSEIMDCVEVFGRLDLLLSANVTAMATEVWRPFGQDMSTNARPVLGGNIMVMLGHLLSGLVSNSSLLSLVDFNAKTNFDGLGALGMNFREVNLINSLTVSSNSTSNSTNSSYNVTTAGGKGALPLVAPQLINQYLAANPGSGGQQQKLRQLSDVEVAGLGQLLCGLNGSQWSSVISPGMAVGVREAVVASLICTPSDEVRSGVYGLVSGGGGLAAAANWSTSDVMGLGWLAGILDPDTMAKMSSGAVDGISAEAANWLNQTSVLTADQLASLAPYTASMLVRPLSSNTLVDTPRRRAIRAAGGESPEILRVLDQLELSYQLLNRDATVLSSSPGRPEFPAVLSFLVIFYHFFKF